MNKIIFLLSVVVFLGCSKKIDIEYQSEEKRTKKTEKPPITKEKEGFLEGVWDGVMTCPDAKCCKPKHHYVLTITKHTKNEIKGSLKISNVPEQQYFVSFKLRLNFDETTNVLTIETTEIIESHSSRNCSRYCDDNTYILQLSKDKKVLSGKWTKTDCPSNLLIGATINIEKL